MALDASEFHDALVTLSVNGVVTNAGVMDGNISTAMLPYQYVDQVKSERVNVNKCFTPQRSARLTILVSPQGQGTASDVMTRVVAMQEALETALDALATVDLMTWNVEVGLVVDYVGDTVYWGLSSTITGNG